MSALMPTDDQILDLADLSRRISFRVDRHHRHTFGLGLGFNRLFDLIEEIGLQIGNG